MKKFLLLLSVVALTFTGCYEDLGPEEPGGAILTLGASQINVPTEGGNYAVSIYYNYDWEATTDVNWINLQSTSGSVYGEHDYEHWSEISFSVTRNMSGADRYGVITVACDDYNLSAQLYVYQAPGQSEFSFEIYNISENGASVLVAPTDETRTYYWSVTKATNLSAVGGGTTKEYMQYVYEYLLSQTYNGLSWAEILDSGVLTWDFKELAPDTEYAVYAFGVDANGNLTSTDLSYQTFTTLKSTFDTSVWAGTWNVTSPKVYVQQTNANTENYEEFFLDVDGGYTSPIEIVDGAQYEMPGYCIVYGWDGYFGMEGPAIGVYSGNKIELVNEEIVYEDAEQGVVYQWLAMSAIPAMGYDSGAIVGGEYPPYTFKMDAEGNVTIEAYVGELTTGATFNVLNFNIWPIVGEEFYVWTYEEPVYTFSGDIMTATKVSSGSRALASKSMTSKKNLRIMHKYANAKVVAKEFSAAVKFAK